MLMLGSVATAGPSELRLTRGLPTCCQQKPFTLRPLPGEKLEQGRPLATCLTARETKIWSRWSSLTLEPSSSCQATHGTGSLPATAAPPTTAGFSASRSVLMLSEGTCDGSARSWPDGSQRLAAALKRLAKMFVS